MTRPSFSPYVLLLTLALLLPACKASLDKHTFKSTVYQPLNLEVLDSVTKRRVWFKEIPVGNDLVVDFDRSNTENEMFKVEDQPATSMKWSLYSWQTGSTKLVDKGFMKLSGMPIMMRLSLRKVPEYPSWITPPTDTEESSDTIGSTSQPATQDTPSEPDKSQPDQTAPVQPGPGTPPSISPDTAIPQPEASVEPLTITIDAQGQARVGSRAVDDAMLTKLFTALAKEAPNRPVVIQADPAAAKDRVMKALELAEAAGVKKVNIATPVGSTDDSTDITIEPDHTTQPTPQPSPEKEVGPDTGLDDALEPAK